jgi:hypothetical protein
MKLKPARLLAALGFAVAMNAQAQALDAHAQAEALLSSAKRVETNAPQLASVASTQAMDSQARAANLLRRPLPSDTASSEAATPSQRISGPALDPHELARRLLDRHV